VELDGFDSSKGLVLLAATNRPEVLDPALLRAGRFDRQVVVDRPDKTGRIAILGVHMKKITLALGLDAVKVADLTPGFTGAELANLCNEAALAATRRNGDGVTLEDFTVAIERIVAGLEKKNRVLSVKNARSSLITRWATHWRRWPCPNRIRYTRCLSFRAAWPRSGTRFSARPRNAT